jgi:hypothetical protein
MAMKRYELAFGGVDIDLMVPTRYSGSCVDLRTNKSGKLAVWVRSASGLISNATSFLLMAIPTSSCTRNAVLESP